MVRPKNEVIVDGMPCVRRAGRIWMYDRDAAEYVGRTESGYKQWVYAQNLTRIRSGRLMLTPKDEIDRASGALPDG